MWTVVRDWGQTTKEVVGQFDNFDDAVRFVFRDGDDPRLSGMDIVEPDGTLFDVVEFFR